MRSSPPTLWREPDFLKLWFGQAVSQFGSQVTILALPLAAALTLGASPAQMGLLSALESLPFLLFGLFAGVWVDRLPRRPVLIAADLGRATLLVTLPIAALIGRLSLPLLFIIAFGTGVLTVFFDVAYGAFLPGLIGEEHLVEGNSKLEMTNSAAKVAGPGLTGLLVQLMSTPLVILLDAISFLVSATSLSAIRGTERARTARVQGSNLWREIGAGLKLVFGNRHLRGIAGCTATANLAWNIILSVFILYASRDLQLGAAVIGVIFAAGNVGFLTGAAVASRLVRRLGLGVTLIAMPVLSSAGAVMIALADGPAPLVIATLAGAQFLFGFGGVIYNINQVSLRQALTPDHLRGRMTATMRFVVWGTIPVGALLGGALGERYGLRAATYIGAFITLGAFLWVLLSPVRTLTTHPAADQV